MQNLRRTPMLNSSEQQPKSQELNRQWSDKSDGTVDHFAAPATNTPSKRQIGLLVQKLAGAGSSKRAESEREMQESDSGLLNDGSRRALRRFHTGKLRPGSRIRRAEYGFDSQLAVASLAALPQIGDASFVPIVTNLVDPANRVVSQRAAIAAKECLPYLTDLVHKQAACTELLRASHAGAVPGADILVRPVSLTQDLYEAELPRVAGD